MDRLSSVPCVHVTERDGSMCASPGTLPRLRVVPSSSEDDPHSTQYPADRTRWITARMTTLYLVLALTNCSGGPSEISGPPGTLVASVTPAVDTIYVGESTQIQALDERGRTLNGSSVEWTSSSPSVAEVHDGRVTGISVGRATIRAINPGDKSADALVVVLAAQKQSELIPAFPGAEGWGATALNNCRSLPLSVLKVTNTNETGPGSLNQAITEVRSDQFNVIVFETGGIIPTPAEGLRLSSSCVYVAGQTAPGDGVVIESQVTGLWLRDAGDPIADVVFRHLRFRGRGGTTANHLIVAKGRRLVLDHLSFSWADNYLLALLRYGGMSWSGPIVDVSVQNSIFAEAFAAHPTAFVVNTNEALKEAPFIEMGNLSIHRNLLAHNSHRNPMTAADNAVIANNVIYNWRQGAGMMNRRGTVDWINNYGKAGPMTDPEHSYVINPYCDELGGDFSILAKGNVGPKSWSSDGDNWTDPTRQVACYRNSGEYDGQPVPAEWRRYTGQNWHSVAFPLQLLHATEAYEVVLNDVGANARLTCDGRWETAVDPVDRRIISETRQGSGVTSPPENEMQVGGIPSYAAGTPCPDSDEDGLPDAWERRFLNCDTCASPTDSGRGGYLLIEHYVNGTTP